MLKGNDGRSSSIRVFAFLDAYEKQKCLWDTSLDSYKNKIDRDQAYMAIIEELNLPALTVTDIKLKVKGIRTTYTKELRILNSHKKAGKPYKPKLFWFNRANAFLKNVCACRRKKEILPELKIENQSDGEKDYTLEYTEESYNDEEMILLNEINDVEQEQVVETDQINQRGAEKNYKSYMQVVKEIEEEELQVKQQPQNVDQTYDDASPQCTEPDIIRVNLNQSQLNAAIEPSPAPREDEFDLFCRSLASQLRAIPDSYSRSMAKLKIQQILFEAETGHYKNRPLVTIPIG